MVFLALIKEKIERVRTQKESENDPKKRELLEERIQVLEELLLEVAEYESLKYID